MIISQAKTKITINIYIIVFIIDNRKLFIPKYKLIYKMTFITLTRLN